MNGDIHDRNLSYMIGTCQGETEISHHSGDRRAWASLELTERVWNQQTEGEQSRPERANGSAWPDIH